MTNRQYVLSVYPSAYVERDYSPSRHRYSVFVRVWSGKRIGGGASSQLAWADAAAKLRKDNAEFNAVLSAISAPRAPEGE